MLFGGSTIFGLPAAPTVLFIVALVVVVLFLLWRDSSPVRALQYELNAERAQRQEEATRCAQDIAALDSKVDVLRDEVKAVRSARHKQTTLLATTQFAARVQLAALQECRCEPPLIPTAVRGVIEDALAQSLEPQEVS